MHVMFDVNIFLQIILKENKKNTMNIALLHIEMHVDSL